MRQDGVAPVNYSPKNALEALSSAGVQVLSCGHNHGNDECCSRLGEVPVASLCFGRHSGLGGYNHGWDHGARVFLLRDSELPLITTYVRLRDGSIVSEGDVGGILHHYPTASAAMPFKSAMDTTS